MQVARAREKVDAKQAAADAQAAALVVEYVVALLAGELARLGTLAIWHWRLSMTDFLG